jgi:putative endonuclease
MRRLVVPCLPTGRDSLQVHKLVLMFYVYVLKSQQTKSLYKGQTENVVNRLKEHNNGKVKSTKAYLPWEMVYIEEFESRDEAVKREKYLKSGIGRQFLKEKLK